MDRCGIRLDLNFSIVVNVAKAKEVIDDDTTRALFNFSEAYNQNKTASAIDAPTTKVAVVNILAEVPLRVDINLDGVLSLPDSIMLLQYLSGNITLTSRQLRAADMTNDRSCNSCSAELPVKRFF